MLLFLTHRQVGKQNGGGVLLEPPQSNTMPVSAQRRNDSVVGGSNVAADRLGRSILRFVSDIAAIRHTEQL
jgi:hypothetical protein